jgi:hypothetical protein
MADIKIPGGYFLNPDGQSAHDANGNPVPLFIEEAPLVWSTPNDTVPAPLVVPDAVEVAPIEVKVEPVEKKSKKAK